MKSIEINPGDTFIINSDVYYMYNEDGKASLISNKRGTVLFLYKIEYDDNKLPGMFSRLYFYTSNGDSAFLFRPTFMRELSNKKVMFISEREK